MNIKRYYHVGHTEQYDKNYDEIFGKKEKEKETCDNCKYGEGETCTLPLLCFTVGDGNPTRWEARDAAVKTIVLK